MFRNLLGTLLISLLSVSALWTARADSQATSPTQTATPQPAHTAAAPTLPPTSEAAVTVPSSLPTQPLAHEATELPAPVVVGAPSATREPRLAPEVWREWPVVPTLSPAMFDLLRRGLERENNPHTYSVIGDCQSVPDVFMGLYDRPGVTLGEARELQRTVDFFAGAFSRQSLTVRPGLSVNTVFAPLWADPQACEASETPLACELRINQPLYVFISLGTNWSPNADRTHTDKLRQIVAGVVEQGAVPVLLTKADNVEGDHRLNLGIARVAYDYDAPLLNFWRAVQSLPNRGLENPNPEQGADGNHLSVSAWGVRSYLGLQMLSVLREGYQQASYGPVTETVTTP